MSKIFHPYLNYYLTPDGDIMNSRGQKAKHTLHNGELVLTVRVNKDRNPVKSPVDKFIYEAAVDRHISNYLDIIHVDGDKLNNSLSNLKLVENNSTKNPYKTRADFIATNLHTDAKSLYYSISSAATYLEINPGSISLILNEKRKRAKSKKDNQWYTFLIIIIKKDLPIFLEIKQRNLYKN